MTRRRTPPRHLEKQKFNVTRRYKPPRCIKKDGENHPPPSCILSERGEWGCGWKETGPSISRFERGRGLEVVGRKMVPPPSRALSESGGWRWLERRWPSVSLFEGIGVVGTWKTPPSRRRGLEVVGRKMVPPPSHALSKGGGWRWLGRRRPSISLFEGIGVVGRPLRLAFRAREGDGWVRRIVVVGASTTCRAKRGVVGRVGQSD